VLKNEDKTQIAILEWLEMRYPHVREFVIKIDNEGKRSILGHVIAKRAGLKKGASDLFIAYPMGNCHGLFLEIKADNWRCKGEAERNHVNGQLEFIEKMRQRGYAAEFIIGVDEGIRVLASYLGNRF
jgi:hypothetical protein